MPRQLLALLACALAALALAACGGESESDEEQIRKAIVTSVTTTDPADCETYATQYFLEQSQSEEGEAAVASCEEDVADTSDDPDSVTVSKVDVGDGEATAEVAFAGGGLDRQTLVVSLIEEDGDWKLNVIEGFAVFDRETLVGKLDEGFEAAQLSGSELRCARRALALAADEELEDVVLVGEAALTKLLAIC